MATPEQRYRTIRLIRRGHDHFPELDPRLLPNRGQLLEPVQRVLK